MTLKKRAFLFFGLVLGVLLTGVFFIIRPVKTAKETAHKAAYVGSESCRDCHKKFYDLWAPSFHGRAIQNISGEFVRDYFPVGSGPEIRIGDSFFHAESTGDSLVIIEKKNEITVRYPAVFAVGGKNIYYFLTSYYQGRLQVMPLAYDRNREEWYDNPRSALRTFGDGEKDEVLPWQHPAYTFNTSCWGCHVSQLSTNYDLNTNTYHTTWKENGINCETCHGPSGDHVRVCLRAGEDNVPEDIRIIRTGSFDHEQQNTNCGSCHSKMRPITAAFTPGGKFFDNFDLTTLESNDFYPDGRDLGENYTYTSWLQSTCVRNGDLDCIHCHTSSGRYRFAEGDRNRACMPCHEKQVSHVRDHSHHSTGSEGALCIACHMPETEFARMYRSDHSMRPPAPLASEKFGSPNACNICHADKSNEWSQKYLVKWQMGDHEKEILTKGTLIRNARQHDWSDLTGMFNIFRQYRDDEVFTASFIRLLRDLRDERKWPVILSELDHPSPLVRSAAARSLNGFQNEETAMALLKICSDPFRLVRISAAESLTYFSPGLLGNKNSAPFEKAMKEYLSSLSSRKDDWASQATLGNFYLNIQNNDSALEHYRISLRLNPDNAAALANCGLIYSLKGDPDMAEKQFLKAIELEPENEGAVQNYALLLGETGRPADAAVQFKKVLEINPYSAVAPYNLSVIESSGNLPAAIDYARLAAENDSTNPKYAYSLGYYLYVNNDFSKAEKVLGKLIGEFPSYGGAYLLLYEVYRKRGDEVLANGLADRAIQENRLNMKIRMRFQKLRQASVQ